MFIKEPPLLSAFKMLSKKLKKIQEVSTMLEKNDLINTFNLISSATTSVILSADNKISNNLARSLCCLHFENAQHYSPKNTDKISNTIKELLTRFEIENNKKTELLILDFIQIANEFDCGKLVTVLGEINTLALKQNFKSILIFSTNSSSLSERVYSNLTHEQKQQILMLTMNDEQTIKLTVETGKHKGKIILYEFDSEVELLKETN